MSPTIKENNCKSTSCADLPLQDKTNILNILNPLQIVSDQETKCLDVSKTSTSSAKEHARTNYSHNESDIAFLTVNENKTTKIIPKCAKIMTKFLLQ